MRQALEDDSEVGILLGESRVAWVIAATGFAPAAGSSGAGTRFCPRAQPPFQRWEHTDPQNHLRDPLRPTVPVRLYEMSFPMAGAGAEDPRPLAGGPSCGLRNNCDDEAAGGFCSAFYFFCFEIYSRICPTLGLELT
jgi:hypothetical protein